MGFGSRTYCLVFTVCFAALALSACKKEQLDWQQVQQLDSHTTDRLNEVMFINDSIGFAVGGQRFYTATLLTTRDGGSTWETHSFPEAGKGLYGITTDNNGTIYICGFDGKLLYSEDKGTTWQFNQLSIWDSYKGLAFAGDKGLAIGGISFSKGFITQLSNKNVSLHDTTAYELNDIEMTDDNTGYISGFGVVMKTTDGGNTWAMQDINNDNFSAICVWDKLHAWVCGYNGSIHYTENGGDKWEKLKGANAALGSKHRLLDILFTNPTDGWACGEEGLLLYTQDGGHRWKEYKHFTNEALRSISSSPDGHIIVAGDNGALYKLAAR
ncbi:MAG: hypothetical protein EOP56_01775 [Sphingobacteriales bacterium]|nr:MAG: hypothetical protein EOP56_01775 [Sphingobacteriales bacterium]